MIVCSCNVLSDCQIRATVDAQAGGARTPGQVYRCLGCSPQCGRCARTIKKILDDAIGACESSCATCPAHVMVANMDMTNVNMPMGAGAMLGDILADSVPHFHGAAE